MPENFGRYQLLERIDVGGMAEVFRAVSKGVAGFERVLAIKRILPNIAADADVIRMFVDEAKLSVQLSHPNIAQVFDLGEVDGAYFIAMEFVDGHSLKNAWERLRGRMASFPLDVACHVLVHVADALHYAHFAEDAFGRPLGIIHRDVSPANVLLSFGGEVKMIDFGLAKAANRASVTRDGVVKGKLAYLSPEQAHGQKIDRRSDLFSFGVCAWELITGERAFRRDDDRETVLAIRRGEIPPPSTYANVPGELERIVLKALAPDRDARYRTALEIKDDLAAFARKSRLHVDRQDLAAWMRQTFPERFDDEPAVDGAIHLVQRKSARPSPIPTPPLTEPLPEDYEPDTTEIRLDSEEVTSPGEEVALSEDTTPNARFPPDSER